MQGERKGRRSARASLNGDGETSSAATRGEQQDPPAFEEALEQLDQIVGQLENGQIQLDEALALFERGVWLAQRCQETLDNAELRVQRLRGSTGTPDALDGGATYILETFELDEG
ncbi:MAG TPA: exodeoxyribonuclease VII small subunit [Ktedonobacterales bacterium]|nr:exodeoxyribonuclease VII small subunit [Ktedonobacterales bacterium]